MTLEVAQLIDNKYRINRLIGEGGMGAVYEGENIRINRRVAIKVLHAAHTANAEVLQRFEREAQAAGRIGNDHILEVLDLGTLPDGDTFIVMEFLDGQALTDRIRDRGRLTPHELTPLIRQTLIGLSAAHRAGIVHRDLKPDNIFVLKEKAGNLDFVKIIDFGISKFQPLSGDGMKMTRTGAVMGTPYYMSPEQASGSTEADQRSDIYSLGVIMFEALTGQVPFDAATFNQLMFKIVLADVPRAETFVPDLDPAFSSIVSKAMARDVTQRFQSTAELMQALDNWLAHGAAVTVPPEAAGPPSALLPGTAALRPGAQGPASTVAGGQRNPATAGNWATSQSDVAVPKKSSGGVIAAAVVAAVVLIGGAAFAMKAMGKKDAAAEAAAQAAASVEASAANATPPAPAPPPPQVEPIATAEAAPTPSISAAPAAASASAEAPVAKVGAAATKALHVKPAAAPAPKPAAAPAPKPAAPKPGGAPDFGY